MSPVTPVAPVGAQQPTSSPDGAAGCHGQAQMQLFEQLVNAEQMLMPMTQRTLSSSHRASEEEDEQ